MSRPITKFGKRAERLRANAMRFYRRQQEKFRAKGLNSRGFKSRYRKYDIPAHGKLRKKLRQRMYAVRLLEQGLSVRRNAIPDHPLNRGKIVAKVGWWEWLKFQAEQEKTKIDTIRARVVRGEGPKPFGSHGHKLITIRFTPELFAKFLEQRLMEKFKTCECGQTAVTRINDKTWVCLTCHDAYSKSLEREKRREEEERRAQYELDFVEEYKPYVTSFSKIRAAD